MARVRVVIYREASDEVLEDFVCEDKDSNARKTAMLVLGSISGDYYLAPTSELVAKGETV